MRVAVPDVTDFDHDRYHSLHGTIVTVLEDDADLVTGDDREGAMYRVELETGEQQTFGGGTYDRH